MVELILAVVCTGALEVDVHQRDGDMQSGTVVSLGVDELTIQTDQRTSAIATANVRELRAKDQTKLLPEKPVVRVMLRGGSVVAAADYTTKDGAATIKLLSGDHLKLATRDVELVVLSSPNEEIEQNRNQILSRQVAGDIVIIRRKNQNLDYVEGILGDVSNEKVQFKFDNDWIGVSRGRIDSFCYFRPKTDELGKPQCQLVTKDGSTWEATRLTVQADRLQLTLADDIRIELPAELVHSIKFVSSATVYLSELEPQKVVMTPSLQIAALKEDLAELDAPEPFLPTNDESLFGYQQNLALATSDGTLQEYDKGVAIHSRTELTYRLAGEYRQFDAVVGLDPLVRKAGRVNLVIRADNIELFHSEIHGGMSPTILKLDVSGANWLTILVDYGDASDVADRLNLCDARLTK